MSESLFTTQTPTLGNQNDGTPSIATAISLKFTAGGTVSGIRFWATSGAGADNQDYRVELWRLDHSTPNSGGTRIARAWVHSTSLTPGGWNVVAFDGATVGGNPANSNPVAVTGNTELYRAVVDSGTTGRYVATAAFFNVGLGNGQHIYAPADGEDAIGTGTVSQGTFLSPTTGSMPSATFNHTNYFVDVVFTPSAGGPSKGSLFMPFFN